MKKSGRILLAADLGKEYKIKDIDGKVCCDFYKNFKKGHQNQ